MAALLWILAVILVIAGVVTEIPATEPDQASERSMTATPFSCEVLGIDDRTVIDHPRRS